MATVTRDMTTRATPAQVLEYLKDFSNATQWDPGTVSCERIDAGPIQVGSRWLNKSKIAGVSTELIYELIDLTEDRVVLKGANDTATATDEITVTPSGDGSKVHYQAIIEFRGAAKLGDPIAKLVFERVGNEVVQTMTKALDALVTPG